MSQLQPATDEIVNPIPALPRPNEIRARATILLVEDETFLRDIAAEVLEAEGYRVLKARHAAEAMVEFRKYRSIVRLLLTDVVLPGKNGRDLAREIRAFSPSLLTLFMSGYAQNAATRQLLGQAGVFYLPKPFTADSLLGKVNEVLESSAA